MKNNFYYPSVSLIFFTILIFLGLSKPAYSAQVDLAWTATAGTKAAGYKIYYGISGKKYSESIDVGNCNACSIPGLEENKTYYFAATVYDAAGSESAYSNEVSKFIPVSAIDTDADGISDIDEINLYGTNPNKADTDGDMISDGDEIDIYGTDPKVANAGEVIRQAFGFDTNSEGFVYNDDLVRGTSSPNYANGSANNHNLSVTLGGIDTAKIFRWNVGRMVEIVRGPR